MLFKRQKNHLASSSHKWRELMFNRLKNDNRFQVLMSDELISIVQILFTLDTLDLRIKLKHHLLKSNVKELKNLTKKIPIDFEENDYPILSLFRVVNKSGVYFIILAEDSKYINFNFIETIKGDLIPIDNFDSIMKIYPI